MLNNKKIGLLGKMCSGKTTLANEFIRQNNLYKKIAFADKIKDLASELFGMKEKDRELLQMIGQKMREIEPNVWINYVLNRTKNEQYLIVDDVKYKNEIEALKNNGFTIIYLEIDKKIQIKRLSKTYQENYQEHLSRLSHESEQAGAFKSLADYTYSANDNEEMISFVKEIIGN